MRGIEEVPIAVAALQQIAEFEDRWVDEGAKSARENKTGGMRSRTSLMERPDASRVLSHVRGAVIDFD